MDKNIFNEEIPISIHNPRIFDRTYVIEQWCRRILYTAFMMEYGNDWTEKRFDEKTVKDFKKTVVKLMLEPLNYSGEINNIIWHTTLNKLSELFAMNLSEEQLLFDDFSKTQDFVRLQEHIFVLTLNDNVSISEDIKSLKMIRNAVAHNRSVTDETNVQFEIISERFSEIITYFKKWLLYNSSSDPSELYTYNQDVKKTYRLENKTKMGDELSQMWKVYEAGKQNSSNQMVCTFPTFVLNKTDDIAYYHFAKDFELLAYTTNDFTDQISIELNNRIPVSEFVIDEYFYDIYCYNKPNSIEKFVNVELLLNQFTPYLDSILGIFISKTGNEFHIKWVDRQDDKLLSISIINTFYMDFNQRWIDIPYEQHDSRVICNPKVWFYD